MGNAANELFGFLHEMTRSQSAMVAAGADGERRRIQGIVSALEREYRKAQEDERARIPTPLSLAIEAMIAMKPQGASPFAERRMQPRDGEMTTSGAKLEPGK